MNQATLLDSVAGRPLRYCHVVMRTLSRVSPIEVCGFVRILIPRQLKPFLLKRDDQEAN